MAFACLLFHVSENFGSLFFFFLQTSLIALLILWFTGNTTLTLLFSAVYGAVVFAITHPAGWISAEVLWYGQVLNLLIYFKRLS